MTPNLTKRTFLALALIVCLVLIQACGSNRVVIGRAEPKEPSALVKKSPEKATLEKVPEAKEAPPEPPKASAGAEPEKEKAPARSGGMMGGMMGTHKPAEPKAEQPKPAEPPAETKTADATAPKPADSTAEPKPSEAAAEQPKTAEAPAETKTADATAQPKPAEAPAGIKTVEATVQPKPADSSTEPAPTAPAPAALQNLSVQGETSAQSSPAKPRPAPPAEDKASAMPSPYKLDLSFGGFGLGIGLFDNPVSVAVDELENIYVIDQGNFRIEKFDRFGLFQFAFGRQGMGDGEFVDGKLPAPLSEPGLRMTGEFEFNKPLGMLLDKDDTRNLIRIHVVDSLNNRIERFLLLQNPPPADRFPADVFILLAKSNPIPVPDTTITFPTGGSLQEKFERENRPVILDPVYIAKANPTILAPFIWGGLGFTQGQLNNPAYLTKDDNNILWVSDTENGRVEGFNILPNDPTRDATFFREFGNDINLPYGAGRLNQPTAIAFDNSGFGGFLVLDKLQGGGYNIQKFDRDGRFTGIFAASGDKEGQFKQPVGIALNPSDNKAFITDRARRKVMVYNNKGEFMYEFGGDELADPRGIAVLRNNFVYVTDSAKNMVYRYVPQ